MARCGLAVAFRLVKLVVSEALIADGLAICIARQAVLILTLLTLAVVDVTKEESSCAFVALKWSLRLARVTLIDLTR